MTSLSTINEQELRSLPKLISWLETMPAEKTYPACNSEICLLAQYYRAHGHKQHDWTSEYPSDFLDVALTVPSTFGAALERARQISVHGSHWIKQ